MSLPPFYAQLLQNSLAREGQSYQPLKKRQSASLHYSVFPQPCSHYTWMSVFKGGLSCSGQRREMVFRDKTDLYNIAELLWNTSDYLPFGLSDQLLCLRVERQTFYFVTCLKFHSTFIQFSSEFSKSTLSDQQWPCCLPL